MAVLTSISYLRSRSTSDQKNRLVRFKMSDELFQDVTSISIGWIKKSLLSHLGIG